MAEIVNSRLCHKFRITRNGSEGIEGFRAKKVASLPHQFPPILHQTKIKIEPGERFRLEYSILNPRGEEIQHAVAGEISNREGTGFINTVFEGVIVAEVGVHVVAILKDGIQIGETRFEILMKDKPAKLKSNGKAH